MKISPVLKSGLCDNCANNLSCTFRSGQIIECEEHILPSEILQTSPAELLAREAASTPTYDGICSTCSLAPECGWIQEGIIRFQCEHYQ